MDCCDMSVDPHACASDVDWWSPHTRTLLRSYLRSYHHCSALRTRINSTIRSVMSRAVLLLFLLGTKEAEFIRSGAALRERSSRRPSPRTPSCSAGVGRAPIQRPQAVRLVYKMLIIYKYLSSVLWLCMQIHTAFPYSRSRFLTPFPGLVSTTPI